MDKISVIVPIYKVEPYLCKCLDSIVGQTYQNLEIILVDDGSPDRCGEICDEYAEKDHRIVVIHKENGGVSSARNAGLERATGDWIGFVDPDDWIEADMYEYLLKSAKNRDADIAVCGMRTVDESNISPYQFESEMILDNEAALENLLRNRNLTFSCCDKLVRRALWNQLCFSDRAIGEDLLAVGALLERAEKVLCLPEIKYYYLTRPGSAMTSKLIETQIACWDAAYLQYQVLAPKWPQLEATLAGRCAAGAIGVWVAYYQESKEIRRAQMPKIREIADFAKKHIKDADSYVRLGIMGRLALRMTPYPTWWAFGIAGLAGWAYKLKHGRMLYL